MALSWSGLLLFDSFIFVLTLCKAIRLWKMGAGRLSELLIRDGAWPFVLNSCLRSSHHFGDRLIILSVWLLLLLRNSSTDFLPRIMALANLSNILTSIVSEYAILLAII